MNQVVNNMSNMEKQSPSFQIAEHFDSGVYKNIVLKSMLQSFTRTES